MLDSARCFLFFLAAGVFLQIPMGTPAYSQSFLMGSAGRVDASSINRVLAAGDVPTLPEAYLSYGGGGQMRLGRVVIGGAGHRLRGFTNAGATSSTTLTGGTYGVLHVGYVVARGGRWRIYPTTSLGGGRLTMEIAQGIGPDADAALREPAQRTRFEGRSFLIGLGVAGELDIPGILAVVKVEAGYMTAPVDHPLTADGVHLQGAPDLTARGPYIRIGIGGGVGALIVGEIIGALFS
ncbi:MAG: hypothetical protein GVY25_09830 [Bacteroidetes bacterium]|jgi:hypothetical protein|nr:hypothetical protein [Bacteroidota bacterium]